MYWYVLIMYQVFKESIVMQLGGLSVVDTQERKAEARGTRAKHTTPAARRRVPGTVQSHNIYHNKLRKNTDALVALAKR